MKKIVEIKDLKVLKKEYSDKKKKNSFMSRCI